MSLTNPVSVVLPPDLLVEAESCADLSDETVGLLVNDAIRQYVRRKARWDEIFRYGQQKAVELGINSEEDVERLCDEYRLEKRA